MSIATIAAISETTFGMSKPHIFAVMNPTIVITIADIIIEIMFIIDILHLPDFQLCSLFLLTLTLTITGVALVFVALLFNRPKSFRLGFAGSPFLEDFTSTFHFLLETPHPSLQLLYSPGSALL